MSPRRRVAGLLAGSANKLYSTLLYHRAPRRSRAPSKVAISAEAEYTLFCIKSCHELEAACGAGLWIPATCPGSESGTCFHNNRSSRLAPAHQGMKSRSCGSVQRIGTADSATPHPDPSGGQAPALHFLIPPSTMGLQFGRVRPWNAGIKVDWRAYPGSESGTCFRINRPCRLPPAHQGMKIGCIGWWESSSVIATTLPTPLDSRLRGNDELGGRNDEIAEWRGSTARSKAA